MKPPPFASVVMRCAGVPVYADGDSHDATSGRTVTKGTLLGTFTGEVDWMIENDELTTLLSHDVVVDWDVETDDRRLWEAAREAAKVNPGQFVGGHGGPDYWMAVVRAARQAIPGFAELKVFAEAQPCYCHDPNIQAPCPRCRALEAAAS